MIAVDTNILVYAHRRDLPWHAPAQAALQVLCTGASAWAIAWPSVHEFYSVVTSRGKFERPSTVLQALNQLDAWLAAPSLHMIGETAQHWAALSDLIKAGKVQGGMVHDARIAAICLQHGVRELWTADRDFSRFPQLKCRNPLVEST